MVMLISVLEVIVFRVVLVKIGNNERVASEEVVIECVVDSKILIPPI